MRIFSVDLERSGGGVTQNFTTQIGVCVLDSTLFDANHPEKCIISTFSEYLCQPENTSWEEDCVKRFWEKNPTLYEKTKEGILSADPLAIDRFVEWVDQHKDPDPKNNLLISDYSAFDFVCLAQLLANHRSLLYLFGEYEQTPLDTTSYYLGLQRRNVPETNTWYSRNSYKDAPDFRKLLSLENHDAGADATAIGLNFLWVSSNIA